MRKVIAVAAIGLGLAWGGVQAENKKLPTEKERLELCSSAEKLASSIMKARQDGMRMQEVMEILGEDSVLVRRLAVAAYERPQFNREEGKAKAVREFENDSYLDCIKKILP